MSGKLDERTYLTLDGLALAQRVQAGAVSAAELLELAIGRTERLNPRINAVCLRMDEAARARAQGALTGPFQGVPFLLKDLLQDLAGFATSNGCRALLGVTATKTDTVVQRWLDAGLVIFGKTATPELGAKGITESAALGVTRNPWNLERTPGGSSGGAAAAVAAGLVPVAAGNDGGGSLRIPAGCTGLFGFKAGRGLVPFGPDASDPSNGLPTHGVISRSVRDSAAMLDLLVGPDAVAAYAPALPQLPYLQEVAREPGPLRIAWSTRSTIRGEPHPEAQRAVEHAAQLLRGLGHHVEEVQPPYDDRALARDFLTFWFVHAALEVASIKRRTGAADALFEAETSFMAALGERVRGVELQRAEEGRHVHIAALARLHERFDLLMTPTLGEPPVRVGAFEMPRALQLATRATVATGSVGLARATGIVDQQITRNLGWVPYTQLANVTGRPAMSVPLHWTADGLPLGVQFVGPLAGEGLLFRLAGQLERAAPWADRRAPGFGR